MKKCMCWSLSIFDLYTRFSSGIRDRISRPYKTKDTIVVRNISISILFGKGNEIPIQAWTDLEGSRKMRLPDFSKIGS